MPAQTAGPDRRRGADRPDRRDRTGPPRHRLPDRRPAARTAAVCESRWCATSNARGVRRHGSAAPHPGRGESRCAARSSTSTVSRSAKLDLALPDDVPFGFLAIPQYATERILREELAMHGVQVERGVRLAGFEQDADGVTATLADGAGEQTVRARIPGRRRRSPQHRPQGAGPDVRGCGLRGAVHARRRRGGLVDARGLRRPRHAPDRRCHRRPARVHPVAR